MAKLSQGILGGISGKIGNLVGSSWKGIPVIKTKPLSVANPQTAGQVAQRSKMTNIVAFSKEILSGIIKPLWDRNAQYQSGYNSFVSENIALFSGGLPSPAGELVMSKGKMQATALGSILISAGAETASITWIDDSGSGYKLATDDAYILLVNSDTDQVYVSSGDVTRADEEYIFTGMTDTDAGQTFYVYLAFRRADGTVIGDSAFDISVAAS